MAKKRAPRPQDEDRSASDYYRLKTDAVDDLISASSENSPEVSREELEKYGARKKSGVPMWLKVCGVKLWFAGAVYFFMIMGLGLWDPLDQVVIAGTVLGMVTDLLTNNAIRSFSETEGSNDRWLMFPKKRYATFLLNIPYAMLLWFLVLLVYAGADLLIGLAVGSPGEKYLIGEPVGFGAFYLLCDVALTALKNLCLRAVRGAKSENTGGQAHVEPGTEKHQ